MRRGFPDYSLEKKPSIDIIKKSYYRGMRTFTAHLVLLKKANWTHQSICSVFRWDLMCYNLSIILNDRYDILCSPYILHDLNLKPNHTCKKTEILSVFRIPVQVHRTAFLVFSCQKPSTLTFNPVFVFFTLNTSKGRVERCFKRLVHQKMANKWWIDQQ